jgi:SAM-dependent methyltransferase
MRSEGYLPVVVDPSAAQRARAAALDLLVVGGVGQALPFADDSFDMAYFHLSLHYGDWQEALTETVRIVRPGGKLWIWTFSRGYLETSFTSRWFPSVTGYDLARFPEVDEVAAHLTASRVESIEIGTVTEQVERSVSSWEEAFRARFVSTLQLIDEDELETGIQRFLGEHPQPEEMIVSALEFASICGFVGD